jgi:hypothetical protein
MQNNSNFHESLFWLFMIIVDLDFIPYRLLVQKLLNFKIACIIMYKIIE